MAELGVFGAGPEGERELEALQTAAAAAAAAVGARGLFLLPSSPAHPRDAFAVDEACCGASPTWLAFRGSVPFRALLPRCAALVHHGGSGTVAAALASGLPQVLLPCVFDQPAAAATCAALGVCPRIAGPASMWQLLDALDGAGEEGGVAAPAAALRAALDPAGPVVAASAAVAARLRAEEAGDGSGVAVAVAAIVARAGGH